jgi:transcriptional regulator with XRE-family HTH domain
MQSSLALQITESDPYKRQGAIVEMARIATRKSRKDLATELSVTPETVRLWEKGDRTISGVMLGRIAIALGQDVSLFLS